MYSCDDCGMQYKDDHKYLEGYNGLPTCVDGCGSENLKQFVFILCRTDNKGIITNLTKIFRDRDAAENWEFYNRDLILEVLPFSLEN
jgi:hypothetical protein